LYNGVMYNIDYNSQAEGSSSTRPSYAVLTSRSWHAGLVNCCMMDGSVQSVQNTIDVQVWQALGTRARSDRSDID
jgi:prepilin-type processing-associated H-X9-DG protein